jgi:hypothetical protein
MSISGGWKIVTENDLVRFLRHDRADEQSVDFSLSAWTNPAHPRLARYAAFLHGLGSPVPGGQYRGVRRADLYQLNQDMQLFVATMVWGFGPLGFGPARVENMLATARCQSILQNIIATARTATLDTMFGNLFKPNGRGRIYGLGTAFGTKLLHVAGHQRPEGDMPLVYDKRVWTSLSALPRYPGPPPKPTGWVASSQYADYCRWAGKFAKRASNRIGQRRTGADVEYALFTLGG